ncbi:MAG: DNRLRE domain-containing protein [Clostridia bacterium]|nr:DNRLRE domain-containing protein [Clostridia bacterium]MCI8979920.1 DNRLRE domain-containing protein [Clostridia bacterium]
MKYKRMAAMVMVLNIIILSTISVFADVDCDHGSEDNISSLFPKAPKQVQTGTKHTLIVNQEGLVEAYGDNTYKQLGKTYKNYLYPDKNYVEGLSDVKKVSSFAYHNLALEDGNVIAWGNNNNYQLGHKDGSVNETPRTVRFVRDMTIVDIAAGGWFSLALDDIGGVWSWGDNKYGQLGLGKTGECFEDPQAVLANDENKGNVPLCNIVKLSAGKYHSLAVDFYGNVYGWGRNSTDHCISESDTFSYDIATKIQGLPDDDWIIDVEAGDRCSFFLTYDGQVYAMGSNVNGQLGDGTTITRSTPVLLDIENVADIESNGNSTLFLKKDGTVFACGANTYGQLGRGFSNTRVENPVRVPGDHYKQIAAGGSHNALYRKETVNSIFQDTFDIFDLYAMGCNDDGQCVTELKENIVYPQKVAGVEEMESVHHFAWDRNACFPIDSTYVSQHDTDQSDNFYNEPVLKINYTEKENNTSSWGKYSYLKFDIGKVRKSSIKSAKLHLYVENGEDYRKSTRTIGVYDTYENTWDGKTMTWNNGRVSERTLLGTFDVTATGYIIEDVGWHEVDITDYLKNQCIDNILSLMLKPISTQAYETVISSVIYDDWDEYVFFNENKHMPFIEIEYADSKIARNSYTPSKDTYTYQREADRNFSNSEFMYINYTPDENNNNYWGQDSYLSFNISNMTKAEREHITNASLWLYVDSTSDNRNSQRTINVSANDGLKYSADSITWNSGRVLGANNIGDFTVQGNGYVIKDPGWRQIDVTEFIKSAKNSDVEFVLKMMSESPHPIKIRSKENSIEDTRPRLVIENNLATDIVDISNNYVTEIASHEGKFYKYSPSKDEQYIFSSVGGAGLSAVLLDEKMNKIVESDDSNGDFKIEYFLKKDKKYYISISSESSSNNEYKLYVETPLTITIH